jgi:hypothetical protein
MKAKNGISPYIKESSPAHMKNKEEKIQTLSYGKTLQEMEPPPHGINRKENH